MKKLEFNFIKIQFKKENYELLNDTYIGANNKLSYICPNGHRHSISWAKWKSGRRCPYCCGHTPIDICYIRRAFEIEGYKLLTTKYKNNSQKLDYICPKGHKYNISWNSWKQGRRCYYCNASVPIDISFVKKEFEKEKYILLTNTWPGANENLKYTCDHGHTGYIRWSNWYSGARCLECSGKKKKDINFIKTALLSENYCLLSNEYKGRQEKLNCVCPNGHRFCTSWSKWLQGCRCPICAIINNSGQNHYNWKGGISCEPYCDAWADKEFKEDIKAMDNYQCQNPDCWKVSKKITIHHIDYDKQNCHPTNLITLCRSCNSRANANRKWHKKFYRNIIKKKYNFKEV